MDCFVFGSDKQFRVLTNSATSTKGNHRQIQSIISELIDPFLKLLHEPAGCNLT